MKGKILLLAGLMLSAGPAGADVMEDYTGPVFPANHALNTPIDALPVLANSAQLVASIGTLTHLHMDFGSSWNDGGVERKMGIPYNVVRAGQPTVPIHYYMYGDESDPGPWPIPNEPGIETVWDWRDATDGDRHLLIVDADARVLYETGNLYWWNNNPEDPGYTGWVGGCGAVFDLTSNALRPDTWTSSDAAGLPIFPLLVRFDEVDRAASTGGEVTHPFRITTEPTRDEYIWPARHEASSNSNPNVPAMGQRFRLRADFDESGFSPRLRVILRAMKKYGLIMADNGSDWFVSGTHDDRWDQEDLSQLQDLRGADFEAVDVGPWMSRPGFDPDSAAVPPAPGTVPAAPSGLSVSTASGVALSWVDNASDENGFQIERSAGGAYASVGTVGANATVFTDGSAAPGTAYDYRVRAYNEAGLSAPSGAVHVVTPASGSSGAATVETLVYPNPAVGRDPVIRAYGGEGETLEVTIFDASGQAVHSDRMPARTSGGFSEFAWTGPKASGIYFAVVHGRKGGEGVRGRVRFAVIR